MSEINLKELDKLCLSSIITCVNNASKYLDDNDSKRIYSGLRDSVQQLCLFDEQRKLAPNSLNTVMEETDDDNFDTLDQRFLNNLKEMTSQTSTISHPYMKEFNRALQNAKRKDPEDTTSGELNDSDIYITQSRDQHLDPITKKPIVDPLTNKHCGHHYERESILELMKKKPTLYCPVASCGNKNYLTVEDLVMNETLKLQLQLERESSSDIEVYELDESM